MLPQTRLFEGLDEEARRRLAESSSTRRYGRGDPVFHEGDPGDALYVVAEGLVKVFITSEAGDERVLATLPPPESFGELALIDGGPRSASAKAIAPTTLVALPRAAFLSLLREDVRLVEALHRSLGRLLRTQLEQASDLVFLDLPGRVAKLLLHLADERGQRGSDGILLDVRVSQRDLADMVGGSRPSVNQILRGFEARGYLDINGRRILLKRPDLLRRRAGKI